MDLELLVVTCELQLQPVDLELLAVTWELELQPVNLEPEIPLVVNPHLGEVVSSQ